MHTYNVLGNFTVKLTAINSFGTDIEEKISFITLGNPPVAAFSGNIFSGTTPLTVDFIDQSSNNPTTWQWNFGDGGTSSEQNPAHIYTDQGSYTVELTVNNSYGSDTIIKVNLITVMPGPCPGTPTVVYEGQTYNTVQIGSQCWFKENLNVGTMIDSWVEQTNNGQIEKYCYDNDVANCATYGALYQWNEMMQYSTQQGIQGICPTGWHIPTDDEWCTLSQFLNPNTDCNTLNSPSGVGTKMKSTTGWADNNGTNESGFTGLPGGHRDAFGDFYFYHSQGFWWTSTWSSPMHAKDRELSFQHSFLVNEGFQILYGFSVRCIKD